MLEPYPWQLGDAQPNVRVGRDDVRVRGPDLLIRYAWLSRGKIFGRAGPLLYPLLFELIAYSLTVG